MARLIQGCDDAMESLMERHGERLFSHLVRVLRDKLEAQEAVQEAFVRVYRYRQIFDIEAKFSTWLYTIALNLARDRLRRRARRPEFVSLEANNEQELGDFEEILLDAERPPDEAMENHEWWTSLADAIAKLPIRLRQSLVLFAEDDKSQAEIAAEMHCTAKAVELRLYHARKRLHVLLGKRFNPREGLYSPRRSRI
jgi:RNA polymerase sigma-70 factor (ECF subfamily)